MENSKIGDKFGPQFLLEFISNFSPELICDYIMTPFNFQDLLRSRKISRERMNE